MGFRGTAALHGVAPSELLARLVLTRQMQGRGRPPARRTSVLEGWPPGAEQEGAGQGRAVHTLGTGVVRHVFTLQNSSVSPPCCSRQSPTPSRPPATADLFCPQHSVFGTLPYEGVTPCITV